MLLIDGPLTLIDGTGSVMADFGTIQVDNAVGALGSSYSSGIFGHVELTGGTNLTGVTSIENTGEFTLSGTGTAMSAELAEFANTGLISLAANTTMTLDSDQPIVNDGTISLTSSSADLIVDGGALIVGETGGLNVSGTVELQDDLLNASMNPAAWMWNVGSTLFMKGGSTSGGACPLTTSLLEAGSLDEGPAGAGEFGFDGIIVAQDAVVVLVDTFDNGNGNGPNGASEAVYANALILAEGATLDLNGLNLYVGGAQLLPGSFGDGDIINSKQDCNNNGVPDSCDVADCDEDDPSCADCNGNGLPDSCDIQSGFSMDCDGNGVPNECEPDCNDNGVADPCDILDGTSEDCNDNATPDECEISVDSPAPGGPFFCAEKCDPDCDENGIPDACDIAQCDPLDVDCADCNSNDVPDACDIAAGTSLDENGNGVPDECVRWDDEAGDNLWSSPLNWEDNSVPGDEDPAMTESVVIESLGFNVMLDINASVDSVVLGATSMLRLQDGDLTIDAPGGISNNGAFEIADARQLLAASPMIVSGNEEIRLDGPSAAICSTAAGNSVLTTIDLVGEGVIDASLVNNATVRADVEGGQLRLEGPNPKTNNGLLTATNLAELSISTNVIGGGDLRADGGTIRIDGAGLPVFVTGGDLTVDGGGLIELGMDVLVVLADDLRAESGVLKSSDEAGSPNASISAVGVQIIESPPGAAAGELHLTGQMQLSALGDFVMDGTFAGPCDTEGGCSPPILCNAEGSLVEVQGNWQMKQSVDLTSNSKTPALLGGDFINETVYPQCFRFEEGGLVMQGELPQSFELAGEDLGASLAGFEQNFAMGALSLSAGTTVSMVDGFDNQLDGGGACDEVLYVNTLSLAKGAMLITGGCRVYYLNLDNEGSVPGLGTDVLNIATGDADDDGDVDLDDYAVFSQCFENPPPSQLCVDRFDADHDGDLDLIDVAELFAEFDE